MLRRAFTLVELLVVLAIIAVLAAVLFPVFSQAKKSAKTTQCLSNIRQLGAAQTMYAQENDDVFVGDESVVDRRPRYWSDLLEPFIHEEAFAYCPESSVPYQDDEAWTFSYAINNVREGDGDFVGAAWAPASAIRRPSQVVLFVDGWPTTEKPAIEPDREEVAWEVGERKANTNPLDDGNPRHSGGFDILFCDGHAKSRKRELRGGRWIGGTRDSEWAARADD